MMKVDSRTELKYLVDEETAGKVSRLAAEFMQPDPHAVTRPGYRYPVHSVYLDSPDFVLFWNTITKQEGRLKLRVRFYDDAPSAPLFLEIKRRVYGHTVKTRCRTDRAGLAGLLSGELPSSGKSNPEVEAFRDVALHWNARPVIHVAYEREAFVGLEGSPERLTLDRTVQYHPPGDAWSTRVESPGVLWNGQVILELKFKGAMPLLFSHLVQAFQLERVALSKYVQALRSQYGRLEPAPEWQAGAAAEEEGVLTI